MISRRTSARYFGPLGSLPPAAGKPDQSVSSFRKMRSSGTPPNTIAPNRPLPMGKPSTLFSAGLRYQSVRSPVSPLAGGAALADGVRAGGRAGRVARKSRRFITGLSISQAAPRRIRTKNEEQSQLLSLFFIIIGLRCGYSLRIRACQRAEPTPPGDWWPL